MTEDNIIYSYTDEQAVEDGVLVPVGNLKITLDGKVIDRITQALWVALMPLVSKDEEGAVNQVELEIIINGLLVGGPKTKEREIWSFETKHGNVWAVLNERERWTLMFPSDY